MKCLICIYLLVDLNFVVFYFQVKRMMKKTRSMELSSQEQQKDNVDTFCSLFSELSIKRRRKCHELCSYSFAVAWQCIPEFCLLMRRLTQRKVWSFHIC